ncbi:hypothetical protein PYW08_012354 [Mythimna loreyi]|uniref:Uncharacterized protein n=1 Tax=Mythimna loreyi TaxID=667449 RepID=A0ACC2Q500_9NEOP|nr:hypothetical protein PYW08_012354 [Mythimna loreyi]
MPAKHRLMSYFGCMIDGPLHRFPDPKTEHLESIQKFSEWKAVLDGPTQERGDKLYNHIRLCNKHFLESYQLPSRRLTKNAVPTLNLNKVVRVTEQPSTFAIGILDTDECSTMESAVPPEPSTSATPVQPIALDGVYHPLRAALSSNPTLRRVPLAAILRRYGPGTLYGKTAPFKTNLDRSDRDEKAEPPEHHISRRLNNGGIQCWASFLFARRY